MDISRAIEPDRKISLAPPAGTFACPATAMNDVGYGMCTSITESAAKNARFCMPEKCTCRWRSCIACVTSGNSDDPKVVDFEKGLCKPHLDAGVVVISAHFHLRNRAAIREVTSRALGKLKANEGDDDSKSEEPSLTEQELVVVHEVFLSLKPTERKILNVMLTDQRTPYIADTLKMHVNTVDIYIGQLYRKIGLYGRSWKKKMLRPFLVSLYREFVQPE
jgi:Bacterial regulatory proteins, luxR family